MSWRQIVWVLIAEQPYEGEYFHSVHASREGALAQAEKDGLGIWFDIREVEVDP